MDAGCKLGKLPFPLPQASGEMGHSGPFVPQGTAGCKKVLFPLPATRTCAGCLLVSHTSPADPNPPSASELGASGLQLINDCACGGQACVGFHHMVLSSPRGWVGVSQDHAEDGHTQHRRGNPWQQQRPNTPVIIVLIQQVN